VALVMIAAAAANLALSLVLTPELGLEGPALATALPFFAAFPFLLRLGLSASGATAGELATHAWGPNLLLGAILAGLLVLLGLVVEAPGVLVVLGAAGVLVYWLAFYRLVLDPGERELARGLLSRRGGY
jgi:hypothetical protein